MHIGSGAIIVDQEENGPGREMDVELNLINSWTRHYRVAKIYLSGKITTDRTAERSVTE